MAAKWIPKFFRDLLDVPAPEAGRFLRWGTGGQVENAAVSSGAYINARDHGIFGDGRVETAEIQAFLDANAGNLLYFPPGTYRVDAPLSVPQKTSIIGAGTGEAVAFPFPITQFTTREANASIFQLHHTYNNIQIRDLTLSYEGSAGATSGAMISITGQFVFIENVSLCCGGTGGMWEGISLNGDLGATIGHVFITNSTVRDCLSAGIRVRRAADYHLTDLVLTGLTYPGGAGVLLEDGAEGGILQGLEAIGYRPGLKVTGSAPIRGSCAAFNHISNSFFDSSAPVESIVIDRALGTQFSNIWAIPNGGNRAILVQYASKTIFSGCGVGNASTGIDIGPFTSGTVIKGCWFDGCASCCVNVAADVCDFIIQGNDMGHGYAPGTGWGLCAVGVNVAAGSSDRYIIADNLMLNCSTKVADGGTGVGKRVESNF